MGDNFDKNRALVERIEAIAEEKGCTHAQLALPWLIAQGPDVIPIPGTKQVGRLEEKVGATNVRLPPAEIERISATIPIGAAARHPLSRGRHAWRVHLTWDRAFT
jgi:aryl-alcohol dehydrogenase-like predicted oxidoreductase